METSIRVPNGAALVAIIKAHLGSRASTYVNFYVQSDTVMTIQSANEFVLESILTGISAPASLVGTSFSFSVTGVIDFLVGDASEESSDIWITNAKEQIVLNYGSAELTFPVSYSERVNVDLSDMELVTSIKASVLDSMLSMQKKTLTMSKVLEVGVPDIIISNGNAWCIYSNLLVRRTAPIEFPPIEIPYTTFNNIVRSIKGLTVNVYIDTEKHMLGIQAVGHSVILVTYREPPMETLRALEERLASCQSIGSFNIIPVKQSVSFYTYFKRSSVALAFSDSGSMSANLSTGDGRYIFLNGSMSGEVIKHVSITTGQVESVFKVLATSDVIDVKFSKDLVVFATPEVSICCSGYTY